MLNLIYKQQIYLYNKIIGRLYRSMIRYKIPLAVDVDAAKILSSRTGLYKIPLKKDQPIDQKQFTIEENQNKQKIIVTSRIKFPIVTNSHQNGNKQSFERKTVKKLNHTLQNHKKMSNLKKQVRSNSILNIHEDEYPQKKRYDSSECADMNFRIKTCIQQLQVRHDKSEKDLNTNNTVIKRSSMNQQSQHKVINIKKNSNNNIKNIGQQLEEFKKNSMDMLARKNLIDPEFKTHKRNFESALCLNNKMQQNEIKIQMHKNDRLKNQKLLQTLIEMKKQEQICKKQKKQKNKLPLQFYVNIYNQIKESNSFFKKITEVGGCILLRMSSLIFIETNKYLYRESQVSKFLYIVLFGRVLLTNKYKTTKVILSPGMTMAEYQLFEGTKKYVDRLIQPQKINFHQEDARALEKCCILRFSKKKYYKMAKEMSKNGFRQIFNLIDNILKINYLSKMQQNKIEKYHQSTEILKHKSTEKNKNNFFI